MLLLVVACSEYQVEKAPPAEGETVGPDIDVSVAAVEFDAVSPGLSSEQTFQVRNIGDAALTLTELRVEGSSGFAATLPVATLDPGSSVPIPVTFTPSGPEDVATLHIYSDDPASPDVTVALSGLGKVAEILIEPDPLDMGTVAVACEGTGTVVVSNVGAIAANVSSVVVTGDFALPEQAPFSLDAGESIAYELSFTPLNEGELTGEIVVNSDAFRPVVSAGLEGNGDADGRLEEEFIQGDGPWERTDLMVYVDQSGSMSDDQGNLAANVSTFAAALESWDLDWQLMVVTADNGCHSGEIFTPLTTDLDRKFLDAVRGGGGRWTEAGLTISAHAMAEAEGCNLGFLRDDSKVQLLLVSDEPEQSMQTWSSLVEEIQVTAPNAAISVICGDLPRGCGSAAPGTGYHEAAAATGGLILSICEADWASQLELVAELSATGQRDTFVLEGTPAPDTLLVLVDEVERTDWTYDAVLNAVVFPHTAMPPVLSRINVTYSLDGDCDG